jgi:hypothetical protein
MWIAGIATCFLAVAGLVAVARSIPASYANAPDAGAPSKYGTAPSASGDAQGQMAELPINRRNRASCPECGVIESLRQIEFSRGAAGQDSVDTKVGGGVPSGKSGRGIPADALTVMAYEITVRLRDGSTTVFNEATPRNWRKGSRVIVIAGSNGSNR